MSCICGGGLLSRAIHRCPVCKAKTRHLTQHSFGGYVTTTYCGRCGNAWQDGEMLSRDCQRRIKFVRENWKHGRPLRAVLDQILADMQEPMPWDKPEPESA